MAILPEGFPEAEQYSTTLETLISHFYTLKRGGYFPTDQGDRPCGAILWIITGDIRPK